MNAKTAYGARLVEFFAIKLNDAGTAYQFLDGSDVVISSPTNASKAYSNTLLESTKPTPQDDGTLKVSWSNYDDSPDFNDFLQRFAVPPAESASGLPDVLWEDSSEDKAAEASSKLVLMISYLNKDAISGGTQRKFIAAIGTIAPTSGSYETGGKSWNKPTLEFVGVKTKADCTIPAAVFNDTKLDVSTAQVIESGTGYLRTYVDAA